MFYNFLHMDFNTLFLLIKEYPILIIAIIPVIETISVILQVMSFRFTGKRMFRMAPLHHHFELSGWRENKVVVVFGFITLIFCILGIFAA